MQNARRSRPSPFKTLLLLAPLAGCSQSDGTWSADLAGLDLTGVDLTGFLEPDLARPQPLCDVGGIAPAAAAFALPAGFSNRALSGLADGALSCDSGANDPTYSTVDLDGDGKPDLVLHDSCTDMAVGTTKWLVHKNTGTGFAAAATEFALPAGFSKRALSGLADGALSCDNGANDPTYSTVDIDGDGKPDLVLHDSCTDMAVGTTKWLVHRNTGAGFAAQATEFALPPGYSKRALSALADGALSCDNGANDPTYSTVDMDGDGKPDLVFHDSCTDMAVGTTKWLVHRNNGRGFEPQAAEFALPPGYSNRALAALADGALSCNNGANDPTYSTVDMDGDGKPDLVFHDSCTDMAVGTTKWLVHRNMGGGFAPQAVDVALPPGYSTRALAGLADASLSCDDGANDPSYAVLDMDLDGKPDFVFLDDCTDMAVGTTKWLVHKNGGTSFAARPVAFALPPGYSTRALASVSDAALSCDNGANDPSYSTVDLDGDRLPDVVFHDSCTDMAVGTSKWLLHRNVCKPR